MPGLDTSSTRLGYGESLGSNLARQGKAKRGRAMVAAEGKMRKGTVEGAESL